MAFNKARVLQEAEYLVTQGKISQAIIRYLSILEREPSEIDLLNTIGDLYVRDRNVAEGLKQFYRLAEAYVQGGFNVKAVAIYKKIVKLDPESVEPLLKLGELYQSQRLVRETRDVYYQIADFYKKRKQHDKALEALRQVVQLDLENATARARLGAFCEEIGQKDEALRVYVETAQLALRREDIEAAEGALEKARELKPESPEIPLLRAREALVLKHPERVEGILSGSPALKDDPSGQSLLIEAQVAMRRFERAEAMALQLVRALPSDFSPLACFVSACVREGQFDAPVRVLSAVADEQMARGNTRALLESLRLVQSQSPQHLAALELIFRISDASGDADALPEILEALGSAYLKCGQFEKAGESFQKLVAREPSNEHYKGLLEQIPREERLGAADDLADDVPSSAAALFAEDDAAPPAEPSPVDERQAMINEAIENSELYARFHLLSRAVAELERVLEIYPDEVEIHKRLVGMCWKSLPERAERAAQALAQIYAQQGDTEGAMRAAHLVGEPNVPEPVEGVPPVPHGEAVEPEPPPSFEAPPPATAAQELDLAIDSWLKPVQADSEVPLDPYIPPPTQGPEPSPFEAPLEPGGLDLALFPSESLSDGQEIDLSEDLEAFLAQMAKGTQAPRPPAATFNYEDSRIEIKFYLENGFAEEAREAVKELERRFPDDPRIADLRAMVKLPLRAPAAGAPVKQPSGVETASVLADSAAPLAAPAPGPRPAAEVEAPAEPAPLAGAVTSADLLGDFTEVFDSAMERLEGPAVVPTPAAVVQQPEPLEDAERHYNLGVAYREMNRLDEAIGEFQKAVSGAENRVPNYYQACESLAACFLEKGLAGLAVKWYGRALETPNLDDAAWLALHYDLGVAYERAGDLPHAWEMFAEVYGRNIGFRDIAEKIRTLEQKGS